MSIPLTDRHSFSYDELIECGKGNLFGPGNALLPLPPMLMFDRIIEINENGGKFEKGAIIAELDVNPDLWFFKCHFETDPVMPGCLGLDAMWQLIGFFSAGKVARVTAARSAPARSSISARCCRTPNW